MENNYPSLFGTPYAVWVVMLICILSLIWVFRSAWKTRKTREKLAATINNFKLTHPNYTVVLENSIVLILKNKTSGIGFTVFSNTLEPRNSEDIMALNKLKKALTPAKKDIYLAAITSRAVYA